MNGARQAFLALLAAESALAHCSELTAQQQGSGSEQAEALARVREVLAEQFKASPYRRLADGGIEMRMPVFGKATILRPAPAAHDALQAADSAAQTAAELADVKADFANQSENRVVISRKLYAELLARSVHPAQGEATMREALEFYADPTRYHGPNQRNDHADKWSGESPYIQDVTRDGGAIARAALAEQPAPVVPDVPAEIIGQAVSDYFKGLDNGDGTFASDPRPAQAHARLADAAKHDQGRPIDALRQPVPNW